MLNLIRLLYHLHIWVSQILRRN